MFLQTSCILFIASSISSLVTMSEGKSLIVFSDALTVNILFSSNFFINFSVSTEIFIPLNNPIPLISLIILGCLSFKFIKPNLYQS